MNDLEKLTRKELLDLATQLGVKLGGRGLSFAKTDDLRAAVGGKLVVSEAPPSNDTLAAAITEDESPPVPTAEPMKPAPAPKLANTSGGSVYVRVKGRLVKRPR